MAIDPRMLQRISPRRSRRVQAWAAALVFFTFAGLAVVALVGYGIVVDYPSRPIAEPGETVQDIEFEVARGSSLPRVLAQLESEGLLSRRESTLFKLYVLHRGMAGRLTAGAHRVRRDMTPESLLEELMRRPKVEQFRVTIPEGKHHLQIADILANAGGPPAAEFVAACRDPSLLDSLGIQGSNAEGFLFPDTYVFRKGVSAADAVRRLVKRHQQVFDRVVRDHRSASMRLRREQGWNHREIVTMASIVEKETGAPEERPLIAGVFLNRLRFSSFKPKLLQTDPTIIYGCVVAEPKSSACREFEGRIRRIHLRDKDNPYNTYTHVGLPPGPISNPGRAAIEAVFAPTKSRYLYFVAKNNGRHYFSSSRAEHERAVDKYIRRGVVGD